MHALSAPVWPYGNPHWRHPHTYHHMFVWPYGNHVCVSPHWGSVFAWYPILSLYDPVRILAIIFLSAGLWVGWQCAGFLGSQRAWWAVVWCGVAVGMELRTLAGHVGLLLWTCHGHQGPVSLNIIQLTCPWLVEESCTQIKTILVTSVKSDEKYVCLLVISMLSILITTNNCTCHDSAAVMAYAEFCSDHCSAIRIRANSVDVWFYKWKPLVWCRVEHS